ncbi:hypothetical protein [Fodinibius sediminis]|uniref:Transglycosylase associated protein n=1 Tax=Fodinibius sediminis TaxID=1214077 RepID=A0A521ED13_9BACT|nr:hypothetical protein [Fodinibius sediminis]SMO81813.1 hypothetical protein SAMN06265218_11527 [Fodinibius sediminis]
MEVLDGTTIFWLLALGLLVGGVVKLVMWNTTVDLIYNLAAGVVGSILVGGLTVALDLPGGMLFAFLGSLSILFILNVFHMQSQKAH